MCIMQIIDYQCCNKYLVQVLLSNNDNNNSNTVDNLLTQTDTFIYLLCYTASRKKQLLKQSCPASYLKQLTTGIGLFLKDSSEPHNTISNVYIFNQFQQYSVNKNMTYNCLQKSNDKNISPGKPCCIVDWAVVCCCCIAVAPTCGFTEIRCPPSCPGIGGPDANEGRGVPWLNNTFTIYYTVSQKNVPPLNCL